MTTKQTPARVSVAAALEIGTRTVEEQAEIIKGLQAQLRAREERMAELSQEVAEWRALAERVAMARGPVRQTDAVGVLA